MHHSGKQEERWVIPICDALVFCNDFFLFGDIFEIDRLLNSV